MKDFKILYLNNKILYNKKIIFISLIYNIYNKINIPSVDNEQVRLGRFLAGKEEEPKVAPILLPPEGGRAELVPGAGSG